MCLLLGRSDELVLAAHIVARHLLRAMDRSIGRAGRPYRILPLSVIDHQRPRAAPSCHKGNRAAVGCAFQTRNRPWTACQPAADCRRSPIFINWEGTQKPDK